MEAETRATRSDLPSAAVLLSTPRLPVARCGAELVGLAERFYASVFAGSAAFVGLASLAALALLPLRGSVLPGGPLTPAVLVAGLLVVAAPLAAWRAGGLYRLLLRHRTAELGLVLVAALLISYPMRSQLWWPSCALLMSLALVVPVPRTLAYCGVVLGLSAASHLVAGDLDEVPKVTVIGLAIGYPLWAGGVAFAADRLAAHLLRLNEVSSRLLPRPRTVVRVASPGPSVAATGADEAAPVPENDRAAPSATAEPESAAPPERTGLTDRLTARQLEVVALLADGLRYRDIAACLSISERQVQRHVANAIARLGVRNAYELVAIAVGDGLVPPQPA